MHGYRTKYNTPKNGNYTSANTVFTHKIARMKNWLSLLIGAVLFISASHIGSDAFSDLTKSGELVVSTVNNPNTFYSDHSEPKGFEFGLAREFADALGLKLRIVTAKNSSDALLLLDKGHANIAALGEKILSAPNFFQLETEPHTIANLAVVYMAGNNKPRELSDLENLRISASKQSLPSGLTGSLNGINENASTINASTKFLLDSVQTRNADVAIVSDIEFQHLQRLYPQLRLAFVIEDAQIPIGWYVRNTTSGIVLKKLADHFINKANESGMIDYLRDESFISLSTFSANDAYTFDKRIQERLPHYKEIINQAAVEFGLEWELLAAISYQESHWNPWATSPTGVRGMMMLTKQTAAELGVAERTNLHESLRGGAKYFRKLHSRLPKDILEPHRTSLALAAYNIGMGHLEDARVLTERMGGDPHNWTDVNKYLPYLQVKKYYETTKYGYARGLQAVNYVENIQNYYHTLIWQELITANSINSSANFQMVLLPNSISGKRWSAL